MSETTTPATACCTPAQAESAEQAPAAAAPCCGTAQDAADAGTCCAPAAKQQAQQATAGCC